MPLGQFVHVPAPARLYVPGPHCIAVGVVDPAGHAYPAVHVPLHREDEERPVPLAHFPAAHREQDASPPPDEYVPGPQVRHKAREVAPGEGP